jgi:repressor of nif and glnA expression
MTRDQTLKKLKILSQTVNTNFAEVNEKDMDEYLELCKYALKQGISESEIENHINPRKDIINP